MTIVYDIYGKVAGTYRKNGHGYETSFYVGKYINKFLTHQEAIQSIWKEGENERKNNLLFVHGG